MVATRSVAGHGSPLQLGNLELRRFPFALAIRDREYDRRWIGRTGFRSETDCERALVGSSAREKWHAPRA